MRRASTELSAQTCPPGALVSLLSALLRRVVLELFGFAPHLRRLFGIARVRQDFTGRAAALDALQGGAVAADPFRASTELSAQTCPPRALVSLL